MKVIISIHDVCPYFRKEIEMLLRELRGVKKSLLITPSWNDYPSQDKSFFNSIAGEDLVLHGLTHKTTKFDFFGSVLLMSKASFKEFYGLNEGETWVKIERAKFIFEDIFNRKPSGFIPPMWYHNSHSIKAIKELGFAYTESQTAFINLHNDTTIFSIPACFDFGNNKLLSYASIFGWKYVFRHLTQSLMRFSIHPSDIKNGFLPDILSIIRSFQSNNYNFVQYTDLIKN